MKIIEITSEEMGKGRKDIRKMLLEELEESIPEEVKKDLREIAKIQMHIVDRFKAAKAVSVEDVKRYNELCYKRFGCLQDGAEFHKDEPMACPECGRRIEVRRRPDDGSAKL